MIFMKYLLFNIYNIIWVGPEAYIIIFKFIFYKEIYLIIFLFPQGLVFLLETLKQFS